MDRLEAPDVALLPGQCLGRAEKHAAPSRDPRGHAPGAGRRRCDGAGTGARGASTIRGYTVLAHRPVRGDARAHCDDDLIIVDDDNLAALSRGTDFSPDEAWADAVAAMGPARARMFSSDADVEPVPGLGFGLGVD